MNHDERIHTDVKKSKSLGYSVFWFGIFALLLYRWFHLNQSLMEVLDVFLVWMAASLAQFFTLATKGIPITYPITANKKEQLYFVFLFPFATGTLTAIILYFLKDDVPYNRILGGFAGAFLGTLVLFLIYSVIIYFWEKRLAE